MARGHRERQVEDVAEASSGVVGVCAAAVRRRPLRGGHRGREHGPQDGRDERQDVNGDQKFGPHVAMLAEHIFGTAAAQLAGQEPHAGHVGQFPDVVGLVHQRDRFDDARRVEQVNEHELGHGDDVDGVLAAHEKPRRSHDDYRLHDENDDGADQTVRVRVEHFPAVRVEYFVHAEQFEQRNVDDRFHRGPHVV